MMGTSELLISDVAQISKTWPEKLKSYKDKGVKIIGLTGRFIPEELICAAGAKPYMICRGGEPEPPDAVLPYMLRFMSPYARAQVGYYLLGIEPIIPILDLIVAQCTDCHMARLADLFEYFKLPTLKIGVPLDYGKLISQEYFYKQLIKLKHVLEDITGNTISNEALKKSINDFNKMRDTLEKINQLRRCVPPPIGGFDFIRLNHFSFCCDIDEVNIRLESIHDSLMSERDLYSEKLPRILLLGHVVAIGDYVVLNLIEKAGGVIVAEILDEGIRHCRSKINTEGDLMKNILDTYYLQSIPPSAFNYSWSKRIEAIEKLIEEYSIDGVLWYQLSFDEIYSMESFSVVEKMNRLKVPCLKIESSYEYSREAMGPLTTRIQSFIESIKTKKEGKQCR